MHNLIAIFAVFAIIYAFVWYKNCGYNAAAFMRMFVKRVAVGVMTFSWVIVLAVVFVLACYSNISELLKGLLSANSISNIKGLTRLVFGVDSVFVALQMLALYSVMVSFVSCLALSVGLIVRIVYRTILKVTRTTFSEDRQDFDNYSQHTMPTFKLYLKYNS